MGGVSNLLSAFQQRDFSFTTFVDLRKFRHKAPKIAHVCAVSVLVLRTKLENIIKRNRSQVEGYRLKIQTDYSVT